MKGTAIKGVWTRARWADSCRRSSGMSEKPTIGEGRNTVEFISGKPAASSTILDPQVLTANCATLHLVVVWLTESHALSFAGIPE